MFSTENGVAALFLKEIPYNGVARVKILSSLAPLELLEECISFCRACGAGEVHASGAEELTGYPLVTEIWEMRGSDIGETDAKLFPLQEETVDTWREIANDRFRGIDNAATLTRTECLQMAKEGSAYFVHRGGELIGIGKLGVGCIDLIASVKHGCGADTVRALAGLLPTDDIVLQVASSNERAIRLYDRLGFIRTAVVSKWYKVF